ncbi:MAG: CHASE2 domain-containing protein [Planctomycetes bacterium]|nr:CHASE2 domain-containing protein [Planctomycetota bacterium]
MAEARRETRHGIAAGLAKLRPRFFATDTHGRAAWICLLIAVGVVIGVIALDLRERRTVATWLHILRAVELKTLDLRLQVRGKRDPGQEVVIVAIDEKSIQRLGRWPWPRRHIAEFVDRMTEFGAKVVAFDIVFAEPQNEAEIKRLNEMLKRFETLRADLGTKADEQLALLKQERLAADDDARLLKAFENALTRNTAIVLGYYFLGREEAGFGGKPLSPVGKSLLLDSAYFLKEPRDKKEREALLSLYRQKPAVGVVNAIDRLAEMTAAQGFVDTSADYTSVMREEYLVTEFNGEFYPPLAVAAVIFYRGLGKPDIKLKLTRSLALGDTEVSTTEKGMMLINYCGPEGTFRTIPFIDVLDRKVDTEKFKGKIVFLGATALTIGDFVATPVTSHLPGVEKHATVAENILHKTYLQPRTRTATEDILITAGIGLVLGLVLPRLAALWGALFTAAAWLGYCTFAYHDLVRHGVWRNVTLPTLTVAFCFALITLYRFVFAATQHRVVKHVFQHYLHPGVVSEILKAPEKIQLGGEKKHITVFFSDIQGFTSISESLAPADLMALLNDYLTEMTDIILARDGFLDKYIGDAIVAAFGPPLGMADHAQKACLAALECQERLAALRQTFKQQGRPEIFMRIGLNSGDATVGNVGSRQRLHYTIIGDAVNLASRLEAANKEFGTFTMVSEATYAQAKSEVVARDLGLIQVVGKNEPVRVFELLGRAGQVSDARRRAIAAFEKGVAEFRNREWQKAVSSFRQALTIDPNDCPSVAFVEKCLELESNPPTDGWNGAYVLKGK